MTLPNASAYARLMPTSIRCESRVNPLGVDSPQPHLSWIVQPASTLERGQVQSACQVLVASSREALAKDRGDEWDSGRVKSDQTVGIAYAGLPLRSSQRVFWKVRVWDGDGKASPWSASGEWTEGILHPADWRAVWITPSVAAAGDENTTCLLRQEFDVTSGLKRAVVHVCGLGQYEMTVNGRKVGDALLTPGWTNYKKTCLYDTYDITAQLRAGRNTVGLLLGGGMYSVGKGRYEKFTGSFGPLKAIAQIELEGANGRSQSVVTDNTWRAAPGPITFSNVYGGEDFDARLQPHNWDQPGFDASGWSAVTVVAGPGGDLKGLSAANPVVRAFDTFRPIASHAAGPGTTVYDMGQNAAVMPRITVTGPARAVVRIIPGELLRPDGSVDQSGGGGPSYWQYTLAGTGVETYFPKFYYRGSRYQQVQTMPAPGGTELPVVRSIETVAVHADAPVAGTFTCSNDLFNRIGTLVRWAQNSNMVSILTDCPHREKLGWLEEGHLNGPALRYNFDMGVFFSKVLNDIADSQTASGLVPSIAPEFVKFGGDGDTNPFRNSPEWGSAFLLIAWQQYQFNGDLEALRRHYAGMKHYVAYLTSHAQGHILTFGLGDWYDIGPKPPGKSQLTPQGLTATAIYFEDAMVLAKAARLLGNEPDARQNEALATEIRAAFNAKFFNAASGSYGTNSQTANAMPLALGIVEPENRKSVLDAIVHDITDHEDALTAGDIGYRYLLRALADNGRSDVIYRMNNQSSKPGYGYQLKRGATSLTEAWDANPSSSQNHFMLGQINEWFYHDLAGIQPVGPGFSKVVIKPAFVGDLMHVSATYESPHGRIESEWSRQNDQLTLRLTIPVNTTAEVYLPTNDPTSLMEGGQIASKAKGVRLVRTDAGVSVYAVGSGQYTFSTRLPR